MVTEEGHLNPNSGIRLVKAVRSINSIRSRVLTRRHELGLTQTELAKKAGVSRKWISTFEKGSSRAELELVIRLIDTLGLDLVIVDRTPPMKPIQGKNLDAHALVDTWKLMQIDLKEIMAKQK